MSMKTTEPLKPEAKLTKTIKLPTSILGMDATPDGKTVYAACLDGGVYAVDPRAGDYRKLGQHDSYASGVALIGDTGTLVSAGYDGDLQWHDTEGNTLKKVDAHRFWSWQLRASPDGRYVASVTGQYLCGGYKYEPAPEKEPSVRVYDARTHELLQSLPHVPSVQSVAFSPDSRYVAAGNLMGEVRIWEVETGKLAAKWQTPDFTGWGIIKGHYYTGGIFALTFTPDAGELYAAGMGTTRDPAAGNGRQLWHRYAWRENPVRKIDETHKGESGRGLMETLTLHPSNRYFVMAGRVQKGNWNAAFFDADSGAVLHTMATKTRVTSSCFTRDGRTLFLGGAVSQGKPKNGRSEDFGRLGVYEMPLPEREF